MGNNNSSTNKSEIVGFRVKEIRKGSPAAKSGLILTSDFVLSANGRTLRTMEPTAIADLFKANENKEVHLKVFNETTCQIRDVVIVPSYDWPGDGILGVILRLEACSGKKIKTSQEMDITLEDIYMRENPVSPNATKRRSMNGLEGNNQFFNGNSPNGRNSPKRFASQQF